MMGDLTTNRILIVDDDEIFCEVLSNAFQKRGFEPIFATEPSAALALVAEKRPARAVIDLRLAEHSGLALIDRCRELSPELKIVMLTGFASIATAIEAIKLGAVHYLTKPANPDQILAAFDISSPNPDTEIPSVSPSLSRIEWEHIQSVLNQCDGNISDAAKRLGLHRRTLQRKLGKRPSGLE